MNLGDAIKTTRKKKGLKQNVFAGSCGITASYLSQIENNLKEPNISTLKTIAQNLEMPLPILFFISIDENDVEPKKREAFKIISPSVNSLISEFFG